MRRVWLSALLLVPALRAGAALAASFPIDPDPASPTLSELLAREASRQQPAPVQAPPAPLPPSAASTQPVIPRGAVTVLTPGARLRDGGIRVLPRR
ncbi:MAG: hypothetical protein LCH38_00885 [Proteobacteria bacterium]|nr:hypothetical protein [Pseudomonadota bacterium]